MKENNWEEQYKLISDDKVTDKEKIDFLKYLIAIDKDSEGRVEAKLKELEKLEADKND